MTSVVFLVSPFASSEKAFFRGAKDDDAARASQMLAAAGDGAAAGRTVGSIGLDDLAAGFQGEVVDLRAALDLNLEFAG